jgi:hypothetical protein
MRARVLALVTAVALAGGSTAIVASAAPAKTTHKPHAGQKCNHKKKAPKGFVCKKNKKGHYVLVKKSKKKA